MTELEYILTHYLGEPLRSHGNGESDWPCPQCGHEKFHTMPVKKKFKHRAKCWRCDFRGDVLDMLLKFHPDENYGDRLARLFSFQKEYEQYIGTFTPGERGVSGCNDKAMVLAEIISSLLRGIEAGVVAGPTFEIHTTSEGKTCNVKNRTNQTRRPN